MTQTLESPARSTFQLEMADLTSEELIRLEDEAGLEYVDDHFEEKNVSRTSSHIAGEILSLLKVAAKSSSDVEIYPPDLCYRCHPERPKWFRKPDVSLIRKGRLVELGDVGMMPIPADLAVEVLSPNDLAREVNRKIEEYLAAGFKLVWVVSPELRMVDIYRIDGSVTRLHENDEITGESALPSFRCKVAEFFG